MLLPAALYAQVLLPKEGSKLNYRIIGFSLPAERGNKKPEAGYIIEIALGSHHIEDSFKKHLVKTINTKTTRVIGEVPLFGKQYTWRVSSKAQKTPGEFHYFSTLTIPDVDTAVTRFRIIQQAEKYKDAYVILDATRAIYDMKGNAVWFLPDIDGISREYSVLKDLRATKYGTLTFIYEDATAYEVDYDGNILWRTPAKSHAGGDSTEHIHHEFVRLPGRHYMILGSEIALWDKSLAAKNDRSSLYFPDDTIRPDINNQSLQRVPFGTIIEYDKDGKVFWSWKTSKYFKTSDIYFHPGKREEIDISPHENSFYFDEKKKFIYLGFRDISRIIKIKYPEGKVVNVYGEIFKPNGGEMGNGLFCKQHSVKLSANGLLYLYNNNVCNFSGFPKVVMLKEPIAPGGRLKKVWEYECTIEGLKGKEQNTYQFTYGGNVVELPDQSIFTSMSTLYCKVFIVSKNKKELWSGIPEKWSTLFNKWDNVMQYKASFINNRKELERIIWHDEGINK